MAIPVDPVAFATDLIRCPSVTPARGPVFDLLQAALEPMGFTVHRWVLGEAPDGPTENMVAMRGSGAPHFGFAGHLDVVPAGDGWSADPFEAKIVDGRLIGRGANDMKSAIAAFIAAVSRIEQKAGTLSLLITGDEEGYATFGTPRIIDWLNERSIRPDMILIGEPTSVDRLGDTVKIGRRGSVNMWIDVPGVQGHVAYPHRANNPVPPLARVIAALDAVHLDDGTDVFRPRTSNSRRYRRRPRQATSSPERPPRSSTSASTTAIAAATSLPWSRRSRRAKPRAPRFGPAFPARHSLLRRGNFTIWLSTPSATRQA